MTRRSPFSRPDILSILRTTPSPLHTREIAEKLGIRQGDIRSLQNLLDDMAADGVLIPRPGQRFKIAAPPSASESDLEGTLTVNARGFGFVACLGQTGGDIFVQESALGGAMHGDKVVVRVIARGSRGPEGEIVKVIDRGVKRTSGTLRRRGKSAWVEPDDTRVRGPIVLAGIDAEGPEGNSGVDGDAVIITITRFPDQMGENPEGRIEIVLGRPGELSVEVRKILALEQIEETHSEEATGEAMAFGVEVPLPMKEGREDLTHLPLPTIDPEDARDHDDAVWVERTDDGGYKAWIAIADVSSYVTPGTHLDTEARARGCSVYLPDRAIPMLPRALSSNLCSLLPGVDRLCLCVEAELDSAGVLRESRLIRGVMRSQAKLTYGGVARALGLSSEPPEDPHANELKAGLQVALELSRLLRGKRMKRGALDFELPEAKIIIDPATALPTDVQRRGSDPGVKKAYQLIEELMLLANETVAHWNLARAIPTIFRVHTAPDEQKLERFTTMCAQLDIPFDVEQARDPKLLAALLKSFSDHPLAPVLNQLLLRSMKQATYDVSNLGHFGLASKAYLHFTSPIRRYPDLVVHRGVHAALLGKSRPAEEETVRLAEAALAASAAERRAMEVERAVVDLYRAVLMRDRIGERYEGTVTAAVGSGLFVALQAPFVDVLIRFEDMGEEGFELDEDGLRAVAKRSGDSITLGDTLMVEVIDVSIVRRTVYGRRISVEGRRGRRIDAKFPDLRGKKPVKGPKGPRLSASFAHPTGKSAGKGAPKGPKGRAGKKSGGPKKRGK